MPLSEEFPRTPFEILDPKLRWYPGRKLEMDMGKEKLLPPLVPKLRQLVKKWRENGYEGASATSKSLLNWWFKKTHLVNSGGVDHEFKYYFAQREAVETVIYLHEIEGVKQSKEMVRFTGDDEVTESLFPQSESWQRYVIKMATGSGKTKVLAILLAWSFFHKTYEPDSTMSRNVLVITPNIIVLDRIRKDFDGLKIFFEDPILPDDGFEGRDWRHDFQLDVHIQDEVHITQKTGNLFVTNIHRVYMSDENEPSANDENTMEYFCGSKPVSSTTDSTVDLGEIVRDIDELVILNDEAHHIHNEKLAWYECILDIHNNLIQKGTGLSMQIDVTATPKHEKGSIFVQTICDYPLVEAIAQDVVKHPILPDGPSREKLKEKKSIKYVDKYKDYIDLGVQEWRKVYDVNKKLGKKSVLFVMTDDTRHCDRVAEYIESNYRELEGSVLTIHTKRNGEISEAQSGKKKDELEKLREQARKIDSWESPFKAIVSVMMLKEGWDVRNVTTIVGLRAYSSKSNILPEQTLGRGLRRMFFDIEDSDETTGDDQELYDNELLCVIGTKAFMEFIESIKNEGVKLGYRRIDQNTDPLSAVVVEVEKENEEKPITKLDMSFPVVTPAVRRDLSSIKELDVSEFEFKPVKLKQFSEEEQKEIVFKDFETDAEVYRITLDNPQDADMTNIIKYYIRDLDRRYHFGSALKVELFGKLKTFIRDYLFGEEVDIDDPNVIRNLSENIVHKTIVDTFQRFISDKIIKPNVCRPIIKHIKLSDTRAFRKTKTRRHIYRNPKKCAFNIIACDSGFEVEFAKFLDSCHDVIKWTYNYREQMEFSIDYIKVNALPGKYHPDFMVKTSDDKEYVIETKGLVGIDVPLKMEALREWCENLNRVQEEIEYDYIFVPDTSFKKYRPTSFDDLIETFNEYK